MFFVNFLLINFAAFVINSLLKKPTRRYFETILSRVERSGTIQEIRPKRRETSILDERM